MENNRLPLLSIIIPVYNVEKYLHVCVDSVICQSFQDYELILVDDGSPDSCPAICDEYAARYRKVKVIHKKNGGLPDARNCGMLAAIGKYLLFIDSDDFIGENSLSNVVGTLNREGETDVILLNVAHCYKDGTISDSRGSFIKNKLYKKDHMEALTYLTSLSDFTTSACLKLMKREVLVSNNIFFTNVRWCEDTDFSLKLYLCAKTYNYCDSYVYYYRKDREGSITYSFTEKDFYDLLYIISKWVEEVKTNPDYENYSDIIYRFFSFQYCMLISGYHRISSEARKELKSETKKYSWILAKTKDRRVTIVRIAYRFFGLHITSRLLGFYEKLRNK